MCGLSCQVSSSPGAPFPSPVAPMVVSVNLLCILYNCMHAHCHVCRTLHRSQMKTEVLSSILCPNPNNIFYIISYSWSCHYIYVLVIILSNTISIIRQFILPNLSLYLEPASQTGKSSSTILPRTSFNTWKSSDQRIYLSSHYTHIFFIYLLIGPLLYVRQKLCILFYFILFYFICVYYFSVCSIFNLIEIMLTI